MITRKTLHALWMCSLATLFVSAQLSTRNQPPPVVSADPATGSMQDNVVGNFVFLETGPLDMMYNEPFNNDYIIIQNAAAGLLEVYYIPTGVLVARVHTTKTVTSVAPRPGTAEVWIVDPHTRHNDPLPLGDCGNGVIDQCDPSCFNEATENRPGGVVGVIDGLRLTYSETIEVDSEPYDICFRPDQNPNDQIIDERAYVSCSASNTVCVIDMTTYEVVNRIDTGVFTPRAIHYDQSTDRVYVVSHLSGNNSGAVNTDSLANADDVVDFSTWPNPLPDEDLVVIDVNADPTLDSVLTTYSDLGTILYNIDIFNDVVYIPNTDALNIGNKGVQNFPTGQVVKNQITMVDLINGAVSFLDLDAMAATNQISGLAMPTDIVFDASQNRAFVACYGSDIVLELDVATTPPTYVGHVSIAPPPMSAASRSGPRTLEYNAKHDRLMVYNQAAAAYSIIDLNTGSLGSGATVGTADLYYDPTPVAVKAGRGHIINADLSADNTSSCASCHIDGGSDLLAWDLSVYVDPGSTMEIDEKGPMITQHLRGLPETGPYHWRGEKANLAKFNGAFVELFKDTELGPTELDQMVAYMSAIRHPPNPRQNADRSYGNRICWDGTGQTIRSESQGQSFFMNTVSAGVFTCNDCHQLPLGTSGALQRIPGSFTPPARSLQVTQLRGVADKMPPAHAVDANTSRTLVGSGLTHDGDVASLLDFVRDPTFTVGSGDDENLTAFLEAFDTGLAPSTGFLKTINPSSPSYTANTYNPQPRNMLAEFYATLGFISAQAGLGHADFMVYFSLETLPNQWASSALFYDPTTGLFVTESNTVADQTIGDLLVHLQNGLPLTFVGMPSGSGYRAAVDRDNDGMRNADDPAPLSPAWSPTATTPPAVIGGGAGIRTMYVTTNTLKLELNTDLPSRVLVYLTGDPAKTPLNGISTSPAAGGYDTNHQLVINQIPALESLLRLLPATFGLVDITLELTGTTGLTNSYNYNFITGSYDPVKVNAINNSAYSSSNNSITVDVVLGQGSDVVLPIVGGAAYNVDILAWYSFESTSGVPLAFMPVASGPSFSQTTGALDTASFALTMPPRATTDIPGRRVLWVAVDDAQPVSTGAPYVEGATLSKTWTRITF